MIPAYLDKLNNSKQLIQDYITSQKGRTEFYSIIEYALGDTGKLIRPTITEIVAECLSLESKALDKFKIALEMTHVASLIHDDLPGLDNDSERRGKASSHVKYNEGVAILAGDYLYAEALHILEPSDFISVHDSQVLRSILIDAQRKLNEGQIKELNLRAASDNVLQTNTKEELIALIEKISLFKTGALFAAAGMAPLLISAEIDLYSEMKEAIELFSLSFQLKDDLLDSKHDREINKEFNHISILGFEQARSYYEFLFQNTIKRIDDLGPRFHPLKGFFEDVLRIP